MSVFRENTQLTEQKEITEKKENFGEDSCQEPAKIPYRGKHPALAYNSTNNSTTDIDVGDIYAEHAVDSFVSAEYNIREIRESEKHYNNMFDKDNTSFENQYIKAYGMDNFLENVAHNDLMKYFNTIPNHGGGSSFYYAIVNFIDSIESLRKEIWETNEYLARRMLSKRSNQYYYKTGQNHSTVINTDEFFKMHWIRYLVYKEVNRDSRTTEIVKAMLLKGVQLTSNIQGGVSPGIVGPEYETIDSMEILAAARIIQHDIIIRFSRLVPNSEFTDKTKNRVGFRYFEIKEDKMQLKDACILKVNNGQYNNLVVIKQREDHMVTKELFNKQQNKPWPQIFTCRNLFRKQGRRAHKGTHTSVHLSHPDTRRSPSSTHHSLHMHTAHTGSHVSPSRSHGSTRSYGSTRSCSHHSTGAEPFNVGDIVKLKGVLQDDQEDNNVGMVINVEHYGTSKYQKKYNVTVVLNNTVTTKVWDSSTFEKVAKKGSASTPISLFKQWLYNKVDWSTVKDHQPSGMKLSELVSLSCQWRTELQYRSNVSRGSPRALTYKCTNAKCRMRNSHFMNNTGRCPTCGMLSYTSKMTTTKTTTSHRYHSHQSKAVPMSTTQITKNNPPCSSSIGTKHFKKDREDYRQLLSVVQRHYHQYKDCYPDQASKWLKYLPAPLEKRLFQYVKSKEEAMKNAGINHQNTFSTSSQLFEIFTDWSLDPLLLVQVIAYFSEPTTLSHTNGVQTGFVNENYIIHEIRGLIGTNGTCCFLNDNTDTTFKKQLKAFMENIITSNIHFFSNRWLFDFNNIKAITTRLTVEVGIGLVLLNWIYSKVDLPKKYRSYHREQHEHTKYRSHCKPQEGHQGFTIRSAKPVWITRIDDGCQHPIKRFDHESAFNTFMSSKLLNQEKKMRNTSFTLQKPLTASPNDNEYCYLVSDKQRHMLSDNKSLLELFVQRLY